MSIGEVAPGVFKFLQKDVRVVIGCPLLTTVDGIKGEPEERDAVLNLHVFTHRGDAAVSCRVYLREGDGSTGDVRLANADGTTTQSVTHVSSLDVPEGTGFAEGIRMAAHVLQEEATALFEPSDPEGAKALSAAFDEAVDEMLEGCEDD